MAQINLDSHATEWRFLGRAFRLNERIIPQPETVNNRISMLYLAAIFTPPIYFFVQKRWVAGIITTGLLFFSCILYITMALAPFGLILWVFSTFFAVWDLRKTMARQNARAIGDEVGRAMREQSSVSNQP